MDADVVVVGGGFAGSCAAWVLASRGVRAIVVERSSTVRPCFKAEKLEPYQSRLLRQFGLLDRRRPACEPIREIVERRSGRRRLTSVGEQYGIRYHDTVNQLREAAASRAETRQDTVQEIENSDDVQVLHLKSGGSLRTRLVVLATGGTGGLSGRLGMTPRASPHLRTLSVGFDLGRADGDQFPFRGLNFYVPDHAAQGRVDYVTLFRVGTTMRVNVFTQWGPRDRRVRAFLADPVRALTECFPGIDREIGAVVVEGRAQAVPTRYQRLGGVELPGVVAIGEEFQTVSPATGTGLDKVLTDVDVLCRRHIPEWLSTPGMGVDKIARFYRDSDKRWIDERARGEWVHTFNRSVRPRTARLRRLAWRAGRLMASRAP